MTICQIVPSLEARHGGPSKSVHALSAALARRGHEVELATTEPEPRATTREGNLATRYFSRRWPQRISRSPDLDAWLHQSAAHVYHYHSLWLRPLHYAHQAAARHRVPLVVSPRGMMGEWAWRHHRARKWLAAHLLHRGALAAVDGWHATSEAEAEAIRALGFHQLVCVAPNGVEAVDPSASAAAREAWLQLCPELRGRRVALFYSRFHRKKRVRELIDTWLAQSPEGWLLLVVGIEEEFTVASLRAMIALHPQGNTIIVHSGEARPPPYAVAELFLLPSHNENFGLVVAEALAHGLPAVVTDTTPWQALNEDARGWCVRWSDFDSALQAATNASSEALRERGARARQWVLSKYSWDHTAGLLADFYQRLRKTRA